MDIVLGRIPVLECLRAGKRRARRLFVLEGARGLEELRDAARNVPVEVLPRRDLDRMAAGVTHQGAILQADPLPLLELKPWLAKFSAPDAFVVVLDGVEDPRNFGAIVRSAAACGAAAVIFGKDRAAPLSAAAAKAAAGAMEWIDLIRAGNLARGLDTLKEAGFWVGGLDARGAQMLWEADLSGRTALVVGSEGRGIRRLVYERCDFQLCIPISGPVSSLNASVSAAIALAECSRQRWLKKAAKGA